MNQRLTILVLLTFIGPVQANSSGYTELKVVDTSPYWVAFESPSQHALSMTWAADTLWLSDLFTGVFYKTIETANGLEIVDSLRVPKEPFMQARDITWDGKNLWSINWGNLLRHDMRDSLLSPDLWITEEALHHMKAIAWNGTHIWSSGKGTLYRHSPTDYSVKQVIQIQVQPTAMSFNDEGLWIAGRDGGIHL